eukprot:TRINITY_DN14839_c0_g1_i5.p1 TRINITY_DN14839_c0_g1~~TRINITY_DN14839_c0_g1_i5.p1  ORF type:complete len:753 (-),score=161.50 TRINITY_DN14839_c0_g1_i5:78-2336(-)
MTSVRREERDGLDRLVSGSPNNSGQIFNQVGGDQYLPVDQGHGELASRRPRKWFLPDTQGKLFNFFVGVVVCLNAMLLSIEADIGLLGFDPRPGWTGLETDLGLLTVNSTNQAKLEAKLADGVQADMGLQQTMMTGDGRPTSPYSNGLNGLPLNGSLQAPAQTQQPDPSTKRQLKSGAYTICEWCFLLFFTIEVGLRGWDCGWRSYLRGDRPWSLLDIAVVFIGWMDLLLPVVLDAENFFLSVLRTARVLRVLKIFRVSQELKFVAKAFFEAFGTVFRLGLLILVMDFFCAVPLTSFIGQKAYLWEGESQTSIEEWFGSIGCSLQTLFMIMTLSGWAQISTVVSEVIPSAIVVPCIVLYMVLCCFTTFSLLSGVISDRFMTGQRMDAKMEERQLEEFRSAVAASLTHALVAGQQRSAQEQRTAGFVRREEFIAALEQHPAVLKELAALCEQEVTLDELLHLFDRMAKDGHFTGSVKVDGLVEAMTSIGPQPARAASVLDLKYQVVAVRRESAERAAKLGQELSASSKAAADRATQQALVREVDKARQDIESVQKDVTRVQLELQATRKDVASLSIGLQRMQAVLEQETRERKETFALLDSKLDMMLRAHEAAQASCEKTGAAVAKLAADMVVAMDNKQNTVPEQKETTTGPRKDASSPSGEPEKTSIEPELTPTLEAKPKLDEPETTARAVDVPSTGNAAPVSSGAPPPPAATVAHGDIGSSALTADQMFDQLLQSESSLATTSTTDTAGQK